MHLCRLSITILAPVSYSSARVSRLSQFLIACPSYPIRRIMRSWPQTSFFTDMNWGIRKEDWSAPSIITESYWRGCNFTVPAFCGNLYLNSCCYLRPMSLYFNRYPSARALSISLSQLKLSVHSTFFLAWNYTPPVASSWDDSSLYLEYSFFYSLGTPRSYKRLVGTVQHSVEDPSISP